MPCGFILFFPFSYNAISFLSPRRCVGERVGGWPVLEHNPLQTDGRKMTSKFAHEVGYVCVCAMHSSTCAEKKKCNHRFPSEGDLKGEKKIKPRRSQWHKDVAILETSFSICSSVRLTDKSLSPAHPSPSWRTFPTPRRNCFLGWFPCLLGRQPVVLFPEKGGGAAGQGALFPGRCHRAPHRSHSVPCVFQTPTEAALTGPTPASLTNSPRHGDMSW